MKILRTVKELRNWRKSQPSLGLVPTMGALHRGHLDLVGRSLQDNDATLMSIFVNPSQFAPTEDLQTYPRSFDSDVSKFAECVAASGLANRLKSPAEERTAVFAPTVSEMYPRGIDLNISKQVGSFVEVLGCSHQLEGAVRPQFFRGVATVVTKLLNAAQPDRAYFGQKDVQQTVVVKNLVRDLLIPTEIVVCETAREPNGLAMSSRNAYLSESERAEASVFYESLCLAQTAYKLQGITSTSELASIVRAHLEKSPIVDSIEYISINDLETFAAVEHAESQQTALSAAIRLKNGVRLLDNIIF